jgi:hypothetical protein
VSFVVKARDPAEPLSLIGDHIFVLGDGCSNDSGMIADDGHRCPVQPDVAAHQIRIAAEVRLP